MTIFRTAAGTALLVFGVFSLAQPAPALTEIPAYNVTEIGSRMIAANPATTYSVALAVNESGDAAGTAIVDGYPAPFVYTADRGPVVLPRLGMWTEAVDLTDRDAFGNILVVGTADAGIYGTDLSAVMWVYSTATGTLLESRVIGPLPGYRAGAATGVNNDWLVIGYSTNFDLSGTQAMTYDARLDILAALNFPGIPADVSDLGEIVGGSWIGTLNGFFVDLGAPPDMSQSHMKAVNDFSGVTGYAVTAVSDGAGRMIQAAVRHTPGGGWQTITANSALDTGNDINNSGDVVALTGRILQKPVLYIDALDAAYDVNDLLASGFTDRVVTRAEGINDAGQIAGSGTGGAVLLTPVGAFPPPPAPTDLTAVAHASTVTEPWSGIVLGWTDASDLETGFDVERSTAGAGIWGTIASGWTGTQYWDRNLEPGVTYDYRIRAVGIGGVSGYSNVAKATAPVAVLADQNTNADIIAPTVGILSPASGTEVSGRVEIVFEAADDTGLDFISVVLPGDTGDYVVCSISAGGAGSYSGSCNLNLRKITVGTHTVEALARDISGNVGTAQIQLVVVAATNGNGKCHPQKGC